MQIKTSWWYFSVKSNNNLMLILLLFHIACALFEYLNKLTNTTSKMSLYVRIFK